MRKKYEEKEEGYEIPEIISKESWFISSDNDKIDFGDKNFTIIFDSKPVEMFVTKLFKCPVCGYEADHHTNTEGEPKNKPFCPECFKKAKIPLMELKAESIDPVVRSMRYAEETIK
jgi:hypothetical protein